MVSVSVPVTLLSIPTITVLAVPSPKGLILPSQVRASFTTVAERPLADVLMNVGGEA